MSGDLAKVELEDEEEEAVKTLLFFERGQSVVS